MLETLAQWIIPTITVRTLKATALGTSIVALTVSPILSQQKTCTHFPVLRRGGWLASPTHTSFLWR